MKHFIFLCLFFACTALFGQTDSTATKKLDFYGFADFYYGHDFSKPEGAQRPAFYNSAVTGHVMPNMISLGLGYKTDRFRAKVLLGMGSYFNSNYAAEPGTLKNVQEVYVGLKLAKNKEIWLDAGVMVSPVTNESPVSTDQMMYSRSFGPENVPYYLSGARLGLPLGSKLTWYLWAVNGWQQIADQNTTKSGISQLEYKPNDKLLINWNLYAGDERSETTPWHRGRVFCDLYAVYNSGKKFSASSSFYIGSQQSFGSGGSDVVRSFNWGNANVQAKYKFTDEWSLAGRIEYFKDPKSVMIVPASGIPGGFEAGSGSLCLSYCISNNFFLRFEGRQFFSPRNVYLDADKNASNKSAFVITSMAVTF